MVASELDVVVLRLDKELLFLFENSLNKPNLTWTAVPTPAPLPLSGHVDTLLVHLRAAPREGVPGLLDAGPVGSTGPPPREGENAGFVKRGGRSPLAEYNSTRSAWKILLV